MEKLSSQIEDYLKTIYLLQQRSGGASTNAIAGALSVNRLASPACSRS